ncbi:MAG: glycosyltransferase family 2 protein [Paludibacteraceae bacterium]|nr:glycosyltransferase family 2 protein [Paludibacteraceae bacterium]
MKEIAAITMARNDSFYLNKWITYYGKELGEENLYIFLDGKDQEIPANAGKAHVVLCEHKEEEMTAGDRTRIAFLNQQSAELLKKYDLVIGGDADEYLVVDPKTNCSLKEYLSKITIKNSVSGLGLDVGHNLKEEKPIDPQKPYLSQRRYALLDSQYTKPVVKARPIRWGAGFHRTKNHNYKIDKNLYLFHFGSFDNDMFMQRIKDKEKINMGWSKHLQQRYRTIRLANQKKAKDGDTYLPIARFLQTLIRHPFAWLRPYMYYWKLVVTIPERFKESV